MKCIIVDDEEMAIEVIASHIRQLGNIEILGTYRNAPDAFVALRNHAVDLMFLDIQMPKMDGFSLLRSLKNPPAIILVTAFREFAIESYDFSVTDYLLKPVSFERFMLAMGKVFAQKTQVSSPQLKQTETQAYEPFIYVKSDRQFVKIFLDDILYLESIKNHVKVVAKEKTIITLIGIGEVMKKLPPQRFLRIHRGYIVAVNKITSFNQTDITIGKHSLPIGLLFKAEVLRVLQSHILE